MAKKRSFFERLTGAINTEDGGFLDEIEPTAKGKASTRREREEEWMGEEAEAAQLTVDMYQTPDDIVIKTIVAGVAPDELDISITREMVTITGRREHMEDVLNDDYFHRELYWGAFSRTILLPEEIDVELAEATEKHGVLTIRLPKIDKKKQTKLSVKSG
ncbi:Hsp20/alpha crystallin family protein [Candidatus Wolfebacteria bacterium]|nr:Hsp20/alpha crystallin family protein [Candidatus Wolfebacteria bacterium]